MAVKGQTTTETRAEAHGVFVMCQSLHFNLPPATSREILKVTITVRT